MTSRTGLLHLYDSLPPALKPVAKKVYNHFKLIKHNISLPYYRFLDRYKLNDLDNIYPEEYYKQRKSDPHDRVAETIVGVLINTFEPSSVLDVGCAIGHYLSKFESQGINTMGIEGSRWAVSKSLVDTVVQGDLRCKQKIDDDFELVICIEVAEHIHPKFEENLVDTITSGVANSGSILFTAAPPGQYGKHHINLKDKEHWIKLFENRAVKYNQQATSRLVSDLSSKLAYTPWPLDNIMVFDNH